MKLDVFFLLFFYTSHCSCSSGGGGGVVEAMEKQFIAQLQARVR